MTAPHISVVLPTRNRAGLLRGALRTVCAQRGDDLEIVVSDNASDDDTPAVARETGDPRVRYVRTDRALPQPESWEFALSHARGAWVTFVSDDDGAVPTLLERLRPLLGTGPRVIAFAKAWYIHPGLEPPWPVPHEENLLAVPAFTGRIEEVSARDELARFLRREERLAIPGISNAVVHRSALDTVRAEAGRLFCYPDPAAFACAALLAVEPVFLAVDLPLNVEGVSRVAVSSGYRHAPGETHAVAREYHADELFSEAPLRARTMSNAVAESLLRARRALPDRFGPLELDPVRYFLTCHAELTDPRRSAEDGLGEWHRVLATQRPAVRRAVRRGLARRRLGLAARRAAALAPPARRLVRRTRERVAGATPACTVHGDAHGFGDLPGAARYLDTHLLPGAPAPAPAAAR